MLWVGCSKGATEGRIVESCFHFLFPPPPAGPWRSHIANRGTSFRICSQRLSVQWLSMATSHRWWKHVARSDIGKVYFGVRGKEFLPMIRIWISYLDKLWVLAFMPLGTKIHKDTTFNLNSQSIVFFSAAQEQNLQLTENFTIKALKQRIVYLPGLPAPVMGKRENATPFFSAQKGLSCGSGGATHWHHRCAPRIDACRTNWRLWDLGADSFWVWENESFCNFAVLRCFVFFKGWSKLILVDFGISQESKQHPFWQGGKTCNYRLLQATSIAMCEARKTVLQWDALCWKYHFIIWWEQLDPFSDKMSLVGAFCSLHVTCATWSCASASFLLGGWRQEIPEGPDSHLEPQSHYTGANVIV